MRHFTHLRDLLRATARKCELAQEHVSECLGRYVLNMIRAGVFRPIVMVHKVSYDETPLKLTSTGAEDGVAITTTCKLFVLHSSWGILVENLETKKRMSLHGSWAPIVRTSESTAGECVASILDSAPSPPRCLETFLPRRCIRAVETDEAPGNIRGQRLYEGRPDREADWMLWHSYCTAHKAHSISERTWDLSGPVMKGVLRTLLLFTDDAHFRKLVQTLIDEIPNLCTVVQSDVSHEGQLYRQALLKAFAPRQPMQRSLLVSISGTLLNGDWRRKGVLEHRCQAGCCVDRNDTVAKLKKGLVKLLRQMKPTALCKGNWTDWSAPLPFLGWWIGVHHLLPHLFAKAYAAQQVT